MDIDKDNINLQSFSDAFLIQGKTSEQKPLPEEFALGNLVKLNNSYREYNHGIIVEHIGYNAMGSPHVSLHLYNTDGEIYLTMEGSQTPHYVDFAATEFEVIRVAKTR